MALPPHTIRIKRRRYEDPVQTLLVESKRRRVDGEFCFILHDTVETAASGTASPLPPNGVDGKKLGLPILNKALARQDDDASKDSLQPGSFTDAASSDREGRPIAVDRRLPISKREIKKAVSPARSVRLKKKPVPFASRHRLSESISSSTPVIDDDTAMSPTTKAEVRRYHLSKKMKIENGGFGQVSGKKRERGLVPVFMEGAGRVAKKRSAIKIGTAEGSDFDEDEDITEDSMEEQLKPRTNKKPQTHAREKAMISKSRNAVTEDKPSAKPTEGLEFGFDSDELTKQLQDMVLDYISNQPDLNNYPASNPKSPVQEKRSKTMSALGGGVGAGTWADVEKNMDVEMNTTGDAMKVDSDGEEGEWVYDVYFRQEIKKNKDGSTAVANGDYGVLVISNSDDEQWWYENDEDEESASDVWGSEDEDSNAEEYYKNDYPDEDDDDDDFGLAGSDGDEGIKQYTRPGVRGYKKRGRWNYDSDGSYDLEREDDSD